MNRVFTLLIVLSVCLASSADARVIHVRADAGGAGDGSSWATAYADLQDALAAAVSGDELWIAAGRYYPHDTDPSVAFELKDGVQVYGGFSGTETERTPNPKLNLTYLSGDIDGDRVHDGNSRNVVLARGVGRSTILDGVIIRFGAAVGGGQEQSGGGLHLDDASPTLRNVRFEGNVAVYGGGLHNGGGGHPLLIDVEFDNCTAQYGGGLHHTQSEITLEQVTFVECRANLGGGIYVINHEGFEANRSTFMRCDATRGGGIFVGRHSPTTLTECLFTRNNGDIGAGISNEANKLTLIHCEFEVNNARDSGGAIHNYRANPRIVSSRFYQNQSPNTGGAVFNHASDPLFESCLFMDNLSSVGGAIFNQSSHIRVANCTFTRNIGMFAGGAVGDVDSGPSYVNTIFYGDDAATNFEIYSERSGAIFWHCLVMGSGGSDAWDSELGTNAGGNIDADPMFTDPFTRDVSLREDSPCVNAGTNDAPVLPEFDYEGSPRVAEGVVDIGAYEFSEPVPVTLASFAASRRGADVTVAWAVSDPAVGLAQFNVYRQAGEFRERLTAAPLGGQRDYQFVDDNAPAAATVYWLEEIDSDGARYWHGPALAGPAPRLQSQLGAHPNPFNPSTTIRYTVSEPGPVTIAVFDAAGRRVATLIDREHHTAQEHSLSYRPVDLPSGVYFVRMQTGSARMVQKIVLVK